MTRSTRACVFVTGLLAACASSGSAPSSPAPRPQAELSFAVIAHSEIGLHLRGQSQDSPFDKPGEEAFARLATALHEPQSFPALGIEAPPPELLFVCGNVTGDGKVDENWSAAERLFDGLGLPWYAVAGRSDMNMNEGQVLEGFDRRFGGLVYSFDRSGAHFVALCSASLIDPRPCFSPLQLNWLRQDLAQNADRKPVFVFLYDAPDSAELAPAQVLDLQAALDGHDIAAVFFGNHRGAEPFPGVRRVGGLDCVQCGNFSAEPGGCVLVSIASGRLRVAYRYFDPTREPRLLLEKTLRYRPRAPLTIDAPLAGAPARDGDPTIVVRSPSAPLSFQLDGQTLPLEWRKESGTWCATLSIYPLVTNGLGGAHQIAVGCDDDGAPRLCTRVFIAPSEEVQMRWRRNFAGSLRGSPVWAGGRLAIATTAGELAALDPETGELLWSAQTAAVIGTPLGCADGGVVVGNIKGWIEAYDREGSRRWRYQVGKPVLAGLAGAGGLVFAADSAGYVHALDLSTGELRWRAVAGGPILETPSVSADRIVLCSISGLERTLDTRTGEVLATAKVAACERPLSTQSAGRIAQVGEMGKVELLEAGSRTSLWSWRASAQGYIFAAPLLRADGSVWVAAMDGSLSCLRAR